MNEAMMSETTESMAIDEAGFRAELLRDGYTEVIERSMPAGPRNAIHVHETDTRLLVLEGAFILTRDGAETTYGPGQRFDVPAGTPHAEQMGPAGARYVAGRRHPTGITPPA
jgi:quercetin dioxygenase-like cupin family protein